jgi:hypothetical protein
MALSSIEGCTLGGLDEGRGHNTRILGFRGTLTINTVTATSVHTVSEDGTVVSSRSAGTTALAVEFGHGMTIQVPPCGDGTLDAASSDGTGAVAGDFRFTFGVVGTHASGILTAVADPEVLATSKNNSSIGGQENAVAAANLPLNIKTATVNCTFTDAGGDIIAISASVKTITGNTLLVRIHQPQAADGTDVVIADGDKLTFDIVAFAQATN